MTRVAAVSAGAILAGLVGSLGLAASAPAAAAAAPPGDGPIRPPEEAWRAEVACDSDAALRSADGDRACSVAVDDTTVYVLEGSAGADHGHLVAIDAATGARRWDVTTGPGDRLTVSYEAIVVGDKSHVEVIDPDTGTVRFSRPGRLVAANDYGIVLVAAPAAESAESAEPTVEALDGLTGDVRWTVDAGFDVGAVCRDLVVLVPAPGSPPASFRVVEHHTGATRFSGETPFDPAGDTIVCSGAWLYVTDGASLTEYDSVVGWLNWQTPIDGGAAAVETYRDVALVTSADEASITAVERETGELLWAEGADVVGDAVSSLARLRSDGSTVFTLHPQTGKVVARTGVPAAGTPVRFVAASECRLVVAAGATVVTYGVRDLSPTWEIELPAPPDDVGVAAGTLVVRLGDQLVGSRSPARDGISPAADEPRCTF